MSAPNLRAGRSERFPLLPWGRPQMLQRLTLVAGVIHRTNEIAPQAATSNSPAMNSAWALMSLPPMLRTCPFLIIAIAS